MTPDRYNHIVEAFLKASEQSPSTRAEFVTTVSIGDAELCREVEEMLAADEQCGEFLEKPAAEMLGRRSASIIGQRLGEYEVIELLATGGMGEIFLARDTQLGRRAALKILPEEYTIDPARLRRFEREAHAIAALNHPNIVTIYGVGKAGSLSFLATEFIEGQTLRPLIDAGPLPTEIVIKMAVQAASALTAAHAAGIIHRDIKPENMVSRSDGLLKILDFGLAKRSEPSPVSTRTVWGLPEVPPTPIGLILGTPRYMSPEQARGVAVDARTDIYSLGCVLYELLAGQPAVPGARLTDVLTAILQGQPKPLATLRPNCPSALTRIVGKAMRKDRDQRYQTAKELLFDLSAVQREMETADSSRADVQRRKRTTLVLAAAAVAVVAASFALYLTAPRHSIKSIAVLPFVNEGAQLEYLADGLTDSVIRDLSDAPSLQVISRNSVFQYKGRRVDPALTGAMLKAQAVLLGRVSQVGDRLSVRLELVDVRDNHRIWGEQYNRLWADLVEMQGEISGEVLAKLRLTLSGNARQQLRLRQRVKPEAYQSYLKGHFLMFQQWTEADLRSAINYLHRALDQDPQFALAAAGLANAYIGLTDYVSPKEAMPKAREYALKAIEMGGAPSEAHVALGLVKLLYDWDWSGAEQEFKYDSPLTPKGVDTFSCYLHYQDALGRTNEAVATLTGLLARDPTSAWNNEELGCVSYYARQYDKSLAQFQRTLNLSPNFQIAYINAARAHVQKRMYREAIAELQKGRPIDPEYPLLIAELGYVYAVSGDQAGTRRILEELNRLAAHRYVDSYLIALIYLGSGDTEQAFAYLEKACAERSSSMPWLKAEPKFDSVRSDPRYRDLLRRVGFAM